MNVYVCVKQVPDTEAKIGLKDGTTIDESSIRKWIVNPYDEYAVEEAVRLKEKLSDIQVIVVCLGTENAQEAIRMALAMGADRALHIVCDLFLDHHLIAKALAEAIKNDGNPTIIFTGKQAIDDDAYQVHLRMAHMLGTSAATNVTTFEFSNGTVNVSREIDEGAQEKIGMKLPALVAVTKGINIPRYPPFSNIMKAKKKDIKKLTLSDVGVSDVANFEEIVGLSLSQEKSGGKILEGNNHETVQELVKLLQNEAKVISPS